MDIAEGEGGDVQFSVGVLARAKEEKKAMKIISAMPQRRCAVAGSFSVMYVMRKMIEMGTGLTWLAGGSLIFHTAKVCLRQWSVLKT